MKVSRRRAAIASTTFLGLGLLLLVAQLMARVCPGSSSSSAKPRVAFISGHSGTINDFLYVAQSLGLEVTISNGDRGISGLQRYVISRDAALGVWNSIGDLYCKNFDAVVVSDTIPAGGRPFLEAFTRIEGAAESCLARRVVMHITNRFDFGNYGDATFYETVQASLAVSKIRWAQNNPFEEFYMTRRNIQLNSSLPLIRPQGLLPKRAFEDFQGAPNPNSTIPVAIENPDRSLQRMLHRLLEEQGINYQKVRHRQYGGARGLAGYKCLIDVPYQVSTMALYENLAAGVPYLIPSPGLLASWVAGKGDANGEQHDFPGDGSGMAPMTSPEFPLDRMDFYNSFAKDVIFTFENWDDLRSKLATIDFDAASKRAMSRMNEMRAQTIAEWKDALQI